MKDPALTPTQLAELSENDPDLREKIRRRTVNLREENCRLIEKIARRTDKLLREPNYRDDTVIASGGLADTVKRYADEFIEEHGRPPMEFDTELCISGALAFNELILSWARGKKPFHSMRENLFAYLRVMGAEFPKMRRADGTFVPVAHTSITEAARFLKISRAKHHAQITKLRELIGLRGASSETRSEASRKTALRQHGHDVEARQSDNKTPRLPRLQLDDPALASIRERATEFGISPVQFDRAVRQMQIHSANARGLDSLAIDRLEFERADLMKKLHVITAAVKDSSMTISSLETALRSIFYSQDFAEKSIPFFKSSTSHLFVPSCR